MLRLRGPESKLWGEKATFLTMMMLTMITLQFAGFIFNQHFLNVLCSVFRTQNFR